MKKMVVSIMNADGEEYEVEVGFKFVICQTCEGHGTHLNRNIGEYAYTQEEFEEAFSTEEDRRQYFKRGGIYDVTCDKCSGSGKMMMPNLDELTEEEREAIEASKKDDEEYEALCRMERMMGC